MELIKIENKDIELFININQAAFQKGFETYYGPSKVIIIPREDVLESLNAKGSNAFLAYENNEVVGGVCVVINDETNINALDLLFVKPGIQSKGIGFAIWNEIEKMHPNTKIWKTCTPYFDKRNIHFYVNKCKFHIVKYLLEQKEGFNGDAGQGMFEFEKVMNNIE